MLLAAAAWLRFETLDRRPLWYDEVLYLEYVRDQTNLADVWRGPPWEPDRYVTPPLHLLVEYAAVNVHDSAASARLPSALAGVAAVGLLVALGARLYDRRVGAAAGVLMAVSVYAIDYSQEARPYMLLVALTAGQYLALFAYLGGARSRHLTAFVLCGAGAAYTHHIGVFNQLPIALIGASWVAVRPAERRRAGLGLLAAFAAMALLYLPQVPNALGYLGQHNTAALHRMRISPRLFHELVARWGSTRDPFTVMYELAFAAGVIETLRRRRLALGLLAWLAAPFLFFASVPFSQFFDIRYLISALPAFFLITACGVCTAADLAGRAARSPRGRTLAQGLALGAGLALLSAPAIEAYRVFRITDARCSDFFREPRLLRRNDAFCRDRLLLNSLIRRHRFLVRPAPGDS